MYHKITGLLFLAIIFIPGISFANPDKINEAVNVVKGLCLSGSEYELQADVDGNVTIKNFTPKAGGSLTINIRESGGATALQEELRVIGDKEVRECTQKHIGRILNAIFEQTPETVNINKANTSINSALYLGYVYPEEILLTDFVEDKNVLFYRFTVKENTEVSILFENLSNQLYVELLSRKNNLIAKAAYVRSGAGIQPNLLMAGDYYLKISCMNKKTATSFKMKIQGAFL